MKWKCHNLNTKCPDVSGLCPSSVECSLWVAPRLGNEFEFESCAFPASFFTKEEAGNASHLSTRGMPAARPQCWFSPHLKLARACKTQLSNSNSLPRFTRFPVLLIFSTTSSKVYAKVEPCCSLKLCWIFLVSAGPSSTLLDELLNLLFRDGLFMHHTTNFAWLSLFPEKCV